MRYAIAGSLFVAISLTFASSFGCGDKASINSSCVDFCNSLVDAMDDSDWYHISDVSETKKHCKTECTDTMNELSSDDRADAEECIECLEGTMGSDDDWTEYDLGIDAFDDCESECFDNDDDYTEQDDDAFWFFGNDFWEDFNEHYSNSTPASDGDADSDSDSDSDSDGDTDMYCDGYTGSDECCLTWDACGWANDSVCDCDGYCGWDYVDCGL